MTNESYAKKREDLANLESLLEHPGWPIIQKEIERNRDKGQDVACDVKKPQAERDAGAGAKTVCQQLLEYPTTLRKSLEATTSREQQRRKR